MEQPRADLLVQAATAEMGANRAEVAARLLEEALHADPRHLMALTKLAELVLLRKDHATALELTGSALTIEANFAPAWHQRAAAYWLAGRIGDAVAAAHRALDIQPPNPEYRLRYAQLAGWAGQGARARAVLEPLLQAEAYDPAQYAAAVGMLGEIAICEGRFADACSDLDKALRLRPNLITARMLRGMNLLRLGRYREGWNDYNAREGIRALYPEDPERHAGRIWNGEDLRGKTLLVLDDQGHGDAIQFFRYLPLLHDRGAGHVTWRTFPGLTRLFSEMAPYASVLNSLPHGARFDFECTSARLPGAFGTELATVPATVPYLRAPARLRSGARLPTGRRPKVGLAWSGDARHMRDSMRSIPAEQFLTLAQVKGLRFHSLQHVVRPADLPALERHPAIGREIEKMADFADSAALISRLDLVIAVDTGIAHLAAALGKPVWLIVHVTPDWRWLAERTDSPWYPTLRLFRVAPEEWRDGPGWAPVLGRVGAALRGFAAG